MSNIKKNAEGSGNHPSDNVQFIDIKSTNERWTECELVDGTVLRLKPVIMSVNKLIGATDMDGNPVFAIKSTLVVDVKSAGKS